VQLTPVPDPSLVPGWEQLTANGAVVGAGDEKFVKTPVVYAGIDLNSLDNVDVRASSFSADFFLWLRYQDELNLDPHEVEFPTAISGAQLGHEISRRSSAGFTTVTYRVKGVFRDDYEFSRFPFDTQTLRFPVQFHNSNSYTMILAYGGDSREKNGKDGGGAKSSVLASKLWRLKDELFFRDVVSYDSSTGDHTSGAQQTVETNRINAAIVIERDVLGYAVKNFLPLVCILVAVLVGYAIAPDVINPRVSIGVTALLTTSVLYQKLAGDLPTVTYIIAMDYVFFAFFAFCVLFLALTVVTYETNKSKRAKPTKLLNASGTLLVKRRQLLGAWSAFWGVAGYTPVFGARPPISKNSTPSEASELAKLAQIEATRAPNTEPIQKRASPPAPIQINGLSTMVFFGGCIRRLQALYRACIAVL